MLRKNIKKLNKFWPARKLKKGMRLYYPNNEERRQLSNAKLKRPKSFLRWSAPNQIL